MVQHGIDRFTNWSTECMKPNKGLGITLPDRITGTFYFLACMFTHDIILSSIFHKNLTAHRKLD